MIQIILLIGGSISFVLLSLLALSLCKLSAMETPIRPMNDAERTIWVRVQLARMEKRDASNPIAMEGHYDSL